MGVNAAILSKTISHALRHERRLYEMVGVQNLFCKWSNVGVEQGG
jgi:hypothetical protein